MGDHNRAKGKEGYPTLAYQCITDFNRCILSVYGPQFGTCNDKVIVKHDTHVKKIRTDRLFMDTCWQFMLQMAVSVMTEVCMSSATMVICRGPA